METKDLNSTANGAAKKNDDNKTGKARKVAGMAGGMAAAAAAGVAGTMAAQGMNTPEDEWQDDAATASQPAAPAKAEEAVHTETETEEEVFDVNEIRIDVTEEPTSLQARMTSRRKSPLLTNSRRLSPESRNRI